MLLPWGWGLDPPWKWGDSSSFNLGGWDLIPKVIKFHAQKSHTQHMNKELDSFVYEVPFFFLKPNTFLV